MRKFSFLIVMLLLIVGGILVWWQNGSSAVNPLDKTHKNFVITKGSGIREIANDLKTAGLIKDPIVFFLFIKRHAIAGKIQAGEFKLSPSMNTSQIATALQVGTFDKQITIPEGKRAEEIAEILKKNFSSYQESWKDQLIAQEGYLFPDTYSLPQDASIQLIIATMTNNFDKQYKSIIANKNTKLTKNEIIIIAALVEREAKYEEDRPLVASVILNRLHINMALNIDATLQYALGYQSDRNIWWKKELTDADKKINSPYNTYENVGLPPGAICNPGKKSLEAVMNAPDTTYIYYFSDRSGHNHYSQTYEQHQKGIEKYGI
jgi:UPF0755 protein